MAKRDFNRKEYDKVRKMDHNTMKEYIEGKYNAGYADGQKRAITMIDEAIVKIKDISGIGPKKLEQIVLCFDRGAIENE